MISFLEISKSTAIVRPPISQNEVLKERGPRYVYS